MKGQRVLIRYTVFSALAAALLASAALIGDRIDRARPTLPDAITETDLAFQGRRLRGLALGAEGLIADWYWIQSLQYIGGKLLSYQGEINLDDLRPLKPRLLNQYLENATDLDPHFYAAYAYGAVVLPAIDSDQAIALIKKGIENNPDKWRFYQYLGYIYWRRGEYQSASEAYARGAALPGAPRFMLEMAAAMKSRGGERETARAIYSTLYENSPDAQTRENARLRVLEIDANQQLEAINERLAKAREQSGSCPVLGAAVNSLFRSIRLPANNPIRIDAAGEIVDPSGTPYRFDTVRCRLAISPASKIPKPIE
ncbi:MAG: hypothetical protein C4325_12385 [Blastocatellia bacterium]